MEPRFHDALLLASSVLAIVGGLMLMLHRGRPPSVRRIGVVFVSIAALGALLWLWQGLLASA